MRKNEQVPFLEEFKNLMSEHSTDLSNVINLNSVFIHIYVCVLFIMFYEYGIGSERVAIYFFFQ